MSLRRAKHLCQGLQRGFTLIELMVTVAVIGIVAVIAIPGMQSLINANRLSGASGELTAALQLARSEAMRRNVRVTVCGSSDGATCANSTSWAQLIVLQPNGTATDPAVIRSYQSVGSLQISGPAAGVVFRPSGQVISQSVVNACIATSNPNQNKRLVTVTLAGGIRTDNGSGGTCP